MLLLPGQIPYPAVVASKINVGAGVVRNEVLPQLARPAYVPAVAVNSWVAVQPVMATGVEACMKQQQFCQVLSVQYSHLAPEIPAGGGGMLHMQELQVLCQEALALLCPQKQPRHQHMACSVCESPNCNM